MTPEVIDVTGLPPGVVDNLRRYVAELRTMPADGSQSGPPPAVTPEQRVARLTAWIASQPKREGVTTLDDSRESIYEGCGE